MTTIQTKDSAAFDRALDEVVDMIATTIGPFGTNVSVAGGDRRQTFDDGYEASLAYVPKTAMAQEAAFRVRDALIAQRNYVGDGTSTTALLLRALYFAGRALVSDGVRPREVVQAFTQYAKWACDIIDELAVPAKVTGDDGRVAGDADLLKKVCAISMHGDKVLGDIIGGLVADVGPYGVINYEPTLQSALYVTKTEDYAWRGGVMRGTERVFYNAPRGVEYSDCLLILCNEVMESVKTEDERKFWDTVLGKIWPEANQKAGMVLPLILICRGAQGSVLSMFSARQDKSGNQLPMCIIQAPGDQDDAACTKMLDDLGQLTGATVFDKRKGRIVDGKVSISDIGRCAGVKATVGMAAIKLADTIPGDYADVEVSVIKKELIEAVMAEYEAEGVKEDGRAQEQKQKRLAALLGANGTVYIPYSTETQFDELKNSVEDGVRASMAAMDGVVPGGGKALMIVTGKLLESDAFGELNALQRFCDAICQPFNLLHSHSELLPLLGGKGDEGKELDWMVRNISNNEFGDARELGILDAAKVVKSALNTAMSVAMPLVNTGVWLVAEEG